MVKKIKVFTINRQFDESGTSGTGHVITGFILSNGWVLAFWDTDTPSFEFHTSWENFYKVHIGLHPTNEAIIKEVSLNIDEAGEIAINIGELLINR